MKFIGFTIKGIEEIAKAELESLVPEVKIDRVESKAILFETPSDIDVTELRKLRTFDDISVWVAEVDYDETQSHENLAIAINKIDFGDSRKFLQRTRDAKSTEFSLTVSLPGFENISTNHFKDHLAGYLVENKKWNYAERDHSQFDIRVFKGQDSIIIGVRLFNEPMHKREYKQNFRRGSLRPTIAAALVRLATGGNSGKLIDNFCGSGTILAEALVLGNDIYGGDIHKGSVHFTHQNLENLEFKDLDRIKEIDAQETDFEDGFFDFAVSNLPWGKQIEISSVRDVFTNAIKEYKRILKKDFSLVLLTKHPEVVHTILSEVFKKSQIESFTISLVGQQPSVIHVRNK